MSLENNPKLEECLKIAKEAKDRRDEAKKLLSESKVIEEQATQAFRTLRKEELDKLLRKKKKYEEEQRKIINRGLKLAESCSEKREYDCDEKKLQECKKQLDDIQKDFENICVMFGHDVKVVVGQNKIETFQCKCCGKVMEYDEYIIARSKAKYKGDIVHYYYWDEKPILE